MVKWKMKFLYYLFDLFKAYILLKDISRYVFDEKDCQEMTFEKEFLILTILPPLLFFIFLFFIIKLNYAFLILKFHI